jgi:hypothetical protein
MGTRHGNHRMIGAPGEASQITGNSTENILDSYLDSGLSSTTPIHSMSVTVARIVFVRARSLRDCRPLSFITIRT